MKHPLRPIVKICVLSFFIGLGFSGRPAQAAPKTLKAGKIQVLGHYKKKRRKEGGKAKPYYLVDKGNTFRLRVGGPASFVLLTRGFKKQEISFDLALDAKKKAVAKLGVLVKFSRAIFLKLPAGTHVVGLTASAGVLLRPVRVRRGPVKGELVIAWKEAASAPPPVAEAQPKKPEHPSPPPVKEAPPSLPPPPAEESPVPVSLPPPAPVDLAPEKPAPERAAPEPETGGSAAGEAATPAAAVERRVVKERKIPPEPKPDPAGVTEFGQRGIFRSWAAMPFAEHSISVGAALQYFKIGDFLKNGDDNQRMLTRLTLAGVPIRGLELNTGFTLVSNQNASFEPQEIITIGDPFLGVRYGYRLADWFALGGGIQALFPTGQKFSQMASEGISTRILFDFDFMPLPEALITLNVGYNFDNTGRIFDYGLTEAQAFAAGVNPHDQLLLTLGCAWQFGLLAPFIEYGSALAMGADDLAYTDSPSWLTLGLRVWPLKFHTLHVMAAVDVGLTGMDPPAGAARIPPYNVILSVAYDFGAARPPAVIEREVVRVEKVLMPGAGAGAKLAVRGSRIVGRVLDAKTQEPIGDARVVMGGEEPATFLSDPEQGRFFTCPTVPGPVKITVNREGYREESQVVLVSGRPRTPVTIKLHATTGATYGTLKGTVRSVTGLPLPALISIPARKVKLRAGRTDGKFAKKLATGAIDVLISMPGYMTQRRKVKLDAGEVVILNVELYPKK